MGSTGKAAGQIKGNTERVRESYVVGELTENDIAQWVKSTNVDTPMPANDTTLKAIIGSQGLELAQVSEDVQVKLMDIIRKNRLNGIVGDKWYKNMGDSQTIYTIEQDGKNYYLVAELSNGKIKDKISYAKNPEKAKVSVKYVGDVLFKESPQLAQLLKMKMGNN